MIITKDKKYFTIYLICVICATILTIFVIGFLSYMMRFDDPNMIIILIPLLAILGDIFAYNSFIGYIKTPDVILEIKDDEITFTPDRKKELVTIKVEDIKGVEIIRPLICRSGKRVVIDLENKKYRLEDIDDAQKAYEMLVNKVKGDK